MTVRETEENIEQIFPELSNLIDIINKWLSHGNIDPELAHFIIYLLDYLTTTHKSILKISLHIHFFANIIIPAEYDSISHATHPSQDNEFIG